MRRRPRECGKAARKSAKSLSSRGVHRATRRHPSLSASSNSSANWPWCARLTPLSRLWARHMESVMTATTRPRSRRRWTSIHRRTARSSLPVDDAGAPERGQASAQYHGLSRRPGMVAATPMPFSPASVAQMTASCSNAWRVHSRLVASMPRPLWLQRVSMRLHQARSLATRPPSSAEERRPSSRSHSVCRWQRPDWTSPASHCSFPMRLRMCACTTASCSWSRRSAAHSRSASAYAALAGSADSVMVTVSMRTPRKVTCCAGPSPLSAAISNPSVFSSSSSFSHWRSQSSRSAPTTITSSTYQTHRIPRARAMAVTSAAYRQASSGAVRSPNGSLVNCQNAPRMSRMPSLGRVSSAMA